MSRLLTIAVAWGVWTVAAAAGAKEEKLALDKVPAAVIKAVEQRFPQGNIAAAEKEEEDGAVIYELQVKDNAQQIDVSVGADGAIREIEKRLRHEDLPKPVQAVLASKYAQAKLTVAEEVIHVKAGKESLAYYEVKLKSGDKTLEVQIKPDGAVKQEESSDENE